MHGGKIYICTEKLPLNLPAQVSAKKATSDDIYEIKDLLKEYCGNFDYDISNIINKSFYVLTPNSQNPYKRLYTNN